MEEAEGKHDSVGRGQIVKTSGNQKRMKDSAGRKSRSCQPSRNFGPCPGDVGDVLHPSVLSSLVLFDTHKATTKTVLRHFLRGDYTIFLRNLHFFLVPVITFFPLSSVQINFIPACCLLCVL